MNSPRVMNLEYVRDMVEQIRQAAYDQDDEENATSIERRLYREFAQAIANDTCETPKLVAAEILRTVKFSFRRM